MSVQANPYPLRLEKEHMDKIRVLAKEGRRSINCLLYTSDAADEL